MSEEHQIIEACARALKAARPFVNDGRGELALVETAIEELDIAIDLSAKYLQPAI